MKCYNHHEAEAVGICKNCAKGICTECAVDVGKGLACKNSCEEEVKSLKELTKKAKGTYKRLSGTYYRLAIFCGLMGGFFIFFGIYYQKGTDNFTIPVGFIFLLAMAFMLYSAIKFRNR